MGKLRRVVLHILSWFLIILIFMMISHSVSMTYRSFVNFIYFGIINIAIFYLNYLLILPRLLNQKKYLKLGIAIFSLIIISAFAKTGLAYFFDDYVLLRADQEPIQFWPFYLSAIVISCFFIVISTVLKFILDWFRNEKIKSQLENEKLAAELALLKSQINPHFLFNSLNSIYSLAYQCSEKTPEAILKLSEIMRYMLSESNEILVPLSAELRYLQNYIELQKLRFGDNSFISFEVKGLTEKYKISPLVLIAFVENAFKHGVVGNPDLPVRICLDIAHDKLLFHVSNSKNHQNKDLTSGIGLQNVKRRLELIYKDDYSLDIIDTPGIYDCKLSLNLKP